MKASDLTNDERNILKLIFSLNGGTISDIAMVSDYSNQKIIAVAKKFSGVNFKIGRIEYIPPFKASLGPGIANPNTGICSTEPAEVFVKYNRRK